MKFQKPIILIGFSIYRGMKNVRYDYSSCHIDVPSPLAEEIIEWGRTNVSDDDIYVTQKDPTFGREDEIHVTILYGLHTDDAELVREILKDQGPVKVTLGKVDVFTNPYKFDVVMIDVYSEDLSRLNSLLQKKLKFTNKYPVYNPHVTISYVKKGKGWKHAQTAIWDGRAFVCDYAVFSSKNGTKEWIAL